MNYKVNIVFEKDEHGYYVYAPSLSGCHSQGESFEEAMANIKEAIELYLESVPADEIKCLLSNEILTTTVEVNVA
ncbi:MAG: type II toxin-antitoxin system HicB family antitoxin [Prolixibacteraceae bacterium]|nr:type II toxin-antitoxin system HicB family antitoxin [Prolixibacteraceae bacterium]